FTDNPRFFVTSPSSPFQVVAEGTAIVAVQFAPLTSGPISGILSIQSDDTAHPNIPVNLTATGAAPANATLALSSPALDFGGVPVNQSKSMTLTLRNTGLAALTVESLRTDSMRFSPNGTF